MKTINKDQTAGRGHEQLSYALLALFVVVYSVAVTQWLAAKLGYQPALGPRLIGPFYNPLNLVEWFSRWFFVAPQIFKPAFYAWTGGCVAAALIQRAYLGFFVRRLRRNEGLHGTAHFATEEEIAHAGLLPRRKPFRKPKPGAGVYCGAWRRPQTALERVLNRQGPLRALRHDGPEHVLAIAPTRSGKGVGLVVPTLLSWPHSVFVNDQKGELYALTAGWREKHAGNRVLRFAPGDATGSARFNPLKEIRWETVDEVGDVQALARVIVDPEGKGLNDHWTKTAHALLTGLIIHLHYAQLPTGREVSLPDVASALSSPALAALWNSMLNNEHLKGRSQPWLDRIDGKPHGHKVVVEAGADMVNRPDQERGSVLSTAMSYLALYRDPKVAQNVRESDFTIADLMDGEKPLSLYVEVGADEEGRMRPLMRLLINQMVEVLMRARIQFDKGRPIMPHAHRLLLMLDEFPSYGRLDIFQQALAVMAGFGIKAYLIIQDTAQLAIYGKDEAITSNCHVQIAYAPNKLETAKWISARLGQMTVITEEFSLSGKRHGSLSSASRTYRASGRALLNDSEVMQLRGPTKDDDGSITAPGDLLVMVAGSPPIQGEQSLYFQDAIFSARAAIPPPPRAARSYTPHTSPGYTAPGAVKPGGHAFDVPFTVDEDGVVHEPTFRVAP